MNSSSNITIRPAHDSDIPAIVALLKISLGESFMPKTEAFWRWKHVDNPFGRSPVLLAFHGQQLVGVRAFMKWEWRMGDEVFRAVRAVDTATHPDYQGKGIFTRLTRELVAQCADEGVHFIFNTPNAQSKPGYLKMGWYKVGRLPLQIVPVIARSRGHAVTLPPVYLHEAEVKLPAGYETNVMTTHQISGFLQWRYGRNPNVQYYFLGHPDKGVVIYRLIDRRLGREMRITDVRMAADDDAAEFIRLIKQTAAQSGARFISCAGIFPLSFLPVLPVGPIVTARTLHMGRKPMFSWWHPSIGDMEVF
jgi:GNAT superfamily N-acetyltransferase